MVITEKIDGTNASVWVIDTRVDPEPPYGIFVDRHTVVAAGSRNRFISIENDNFGFARWVSDHAEELASGLGPGTHYGEWWGSGIQRGYGLEKGEKRFSLFNTGRWNEDNKPDCCHVVPVLFEGAFDTVKVRFVMGELAVSGSEASPGFYEPEGVMVYHTAANQMFKRTFVGDQQGKERFEKGNK
jgi:hypothetical protein